VLIGRDGLSCQYGIHGCSQVFAGYRNAGARTAGVKLASVNQSKIGVKQEEIRGACGFVSLGDFP
jgi:hypothetical protein